MWQAWNRREVHTEFLLDNVKELNNLGSETDGNSMGGCGLNFSDSGQGQAACSCQHNELLSAIKCGEFPD